MAGGREHGGPHEKQQPASRGRPAGAKLEELAGPAPGAALLSPQMLLRLQRAAGNSAVAAMLGDAGDPHRASDAHARLPAKRIAVQRDVKDTFPTALGAFDVELKVQQGALDGTGKSGMDARIAFLPDKKSPYTTKLGIIQIIKATDDKGHDLDNIASLPATTGPKIRTQEDKSKGVEGGYFTDVLHQHFGLAGVPPHKQGDEVLPYYQGNVPVFGFRRSEEKDDIRAAEITDRPGTEANDINVDFHFEDVAKGDDNQVEYGAFKWAFKLRKGAISDVTTSVADAGSATFEAALEKHRDFYVHEPVTIYFDFDKDAPAAGEDAKIASFLPYLQRFPDVRLTVTGFADRRGPAAYNLDLARRRARSVADALTTSGVDADHIDLPAPVGSTERFSLDAVTDQDREANRRANRRVTIEFHHTAPAPARP